MAYTKVKSVKPYRGLIDTLVILSVDSVTARINETAYTVLYSGCGHRVSVVHNTLRTYMRTGAPTLCKECASIASTKKAAEAKKAKREGRRKTRANDHTEHFFAHRLLAKSVQDRLEK